MNQSVKKSNNGTQSVESAIVSLDEKCKYFGIQNMQLYKYRARFN